ncbi:MULTISPECIES: hypothetical protein [unclassified Brevundimonas]|uniref:hypothetical protein n=1 Tax=unclassified Brevundimonas TaxID=2622653 RepID=UPI0025C67B76|nr:MULTISPECIES: hypothetical protein [unclassified Brevundimonas]
MNLRDLATPALLIVLATALVACDNAAGPSATVVDTTAIADPPPPPPEPELVPEAAAVTVYADPSGGLMAPDLAEFSDYPARVYEGPRVSPILTPENRNYRTRITQASTEPVNFAGNKVVAVFGCGSGCTGGYIVDVESGNVTSLGLGGESQPYMQLNYRPDSQLLIATWEFPSYETESSICHYQRYVWDGEKLVPSGGALSSYSPAIGMCNPYNEYQ